MWPELADVATVMGDEVATFADPVAARSPTGVVQGAIERTRRAGRSRARPSGAAVARAPARGRPSVPPGEKARKRTGSPGLAGGSAANDGRLGGAPASLARRRPPPAESRFPRVRTESTSTPGLTQSISHALGYGEDLADHTARLSAAAKIVGGEVVADLAAADADAGEEANLVMAAFKPLADLGKTWCAGGLAKIRTRERALEEASRRCAGDQAVAARVLAHVTDWTEVRYDELVLATRRGCERGRLVRPRGRP